MTSFGRTKVKKTSKSIQIYRIWKSPFSKGLQGYTRVSLSVKKIPCDKYMKFAKYDSFITHQHYHQDLMKAKDGGIDTYNQEQLEKIDILKIFLEKYNDGRKKSFYCLAVNLLELEELKSLIKQIETNSKLSALTKKEQAKYVFDLFQDLAKQHSLILKLNKKSKK